MAVETIQDDVFEETLDNNDKVVAMYYADWCGSCKLFKPKYRRLSEDERFDGVKFVNINAEENEKARKKAEVDNLPFFAVFRNGEIVDGTSTSKEDKVVEMLEGLN